MGTYLAVEDPKTDMAMSSGFWWIGSTRYATAKVLVSTKTREIVTRHVVVGDWIKADDALDIAKRQAMAEAVRRRTA